MPPTRRKTSSSSPRAQQTLAFGPNSNKITKPSPLSQSSKKLSKPDSQYIEKAVAQIPTPSTASKDEEEGEEDEEEEAKVEPVAESPRLAIRSQQPATKSDVEEKAAKISNAQVKGYWKAKEDERIAPRVHQQGLSLNEKVLRHFDLSSQYGPCIGITRMKRWKRANGLGLHPPLEVLAVLVKEEKGGNGRAERAFMDDLLTSRLSGVDGT